MNIKLRMKNLWPAQLGTALSIVVLLLAVSAGCSPTNTQPSEEPAPTATQPSEEPVPSATEPQAAPATPLSTATSEALLPAGWATYTGKQCEYTISYPQEMQVTDNGTYSQILGFQLANPEEGARNFVYVSVINPDVQNVGEEGVYNYDPAEAETLLNMQVGESKAVREVANVASGFTYQRNPDTPISDYAAQTYENLEPWEFPGGTKEIRYYLSLNGCTYVIGGYLDTTGSDQPGAITEKLFNQIVATIRLTP